MFRLIAITNRHLVKGDFLKQLEKIAQSGVDRVILREKDLDADTYMQLADKVLPLFEHSEAECSLHFFKEAAAARHLKAVHLPLACMEETDSRRFQTVGVSCHSMEEALEAERKKADYIILGHIFGTDCKKGLAPRGLSFLNQICQAVHIPVYAIGGISENNIAAVKDAGAAGACMMSSVMQADDPEKIIYNLRKALK